jgi:hypothetical protein
MKRDYKKSTAVLPDEFVKVWVIICGRRPKKMYRIGNRFHYVDKILHNNGNYSSIGDKVLWSY